MICQSQQIITFQSKNIISKYKYLEIEIEKFKTIIVQVMVGALGMIKKRTDEYIIKIPGSFRQYELLKLHFAELLISFGDNRNVIEKYHPKEAAKKHKYVECI